MSAPDRRGRPEPPPPGPAAKLFVRLAVALIFISLVRGAIEDRPREPDLVRLRVSPTLLELRLSPGERAVRALELRNTGPATLEVNARLSDWVMEPDGVVRFMDAGSTSRSCAGMVTVIPERVRVASGGSSRVVIVVEPPREPEGLQGTRWAALRFELPEVADSEGRPTRVRLGTAVYVTAKGAPSSIPALEVVGGGGAADLPTSLVAVVSNPGEVAIRFRFGWRLTDSGGAPRAEMESQDQVVLPSSRREYRVTPGALPAGEYAVRFFLAPEGARPQAAEARLVVP